MEAGQQEKKAQGVSTCLAELHFYRWVLLVCKLWGSSVLCTCRGQSREPAWAQTHTCLMLPGGILCTDITREQPDFPGDMFACGL